LETGALVDTIAAIRTEGTAESVIAARLSEIRKAEEERVANAVVLSELLAPLLAQRIGSEIEPFSAASLRSVAPEPISIPLPAPVHAAPRPAAAGIADFIDQMIAQEKPEPRVPSQRRAS
jgi:hypothetical protein